MLAIDAGQTVRILVDTSVWVDFIRNRPLAHVETLARLLDDKVSVCMAPPILQEVLQGASMRENQAALERRFHRVPLLDFDDAAVAAVAAARLYLRCRLVGTTPRSGTDCLIACIAIEHDVPLLHNDRDFDAIARVEPRLKLFSTRQASR